jgi:site-specific recombinase XerD
MEILCHEAFGSSLDLSGFKRPKKHRPNPVVLTPDEVTRIAVATVNPKHRLMIELAYTAGLRVSELVEVKVAHLDLERFILYVPGIGRKSRTTILTDRLKGALTWQVGTKDLNHYLFPSDRGEKLTTRAVAKFFKKALIASGLNKQATPHSLRQSFTHSMLNQGVDPVALQSLLGQHTLTHMPPDSKRAA